MCNMLSHVNKEEEHNLADAVTDQVPTTLDGQKKLWLNGLELLDDVKLNMRILPTGYERIDFLLGGGFREGQLTEIVGPSSSGKTQVCQFFASNVALKQLGLVLLLDTSNSFSSKRIASIISQQQSKVVTKEAEEVLERTMSSIFFQSVFDIFELFDVLQQLERKLKQQVKSGPNKICLLIIDSFSSLMAPILGGQRSQGRQLMVSTGTLLKKLAHEYNLSILVTNHMVGGEGGTLKPALGESWKSIPHIRLLLSCDQGRNNISILKHTTIAPGLTVHFVIPN